MNNYEIDRQLQEYLAGTLSPEETRQLEVKLVDSIDLADRLMELAGDEYLLLEWGNSSAALQEGFSQSLTGSGSSHGGSGRQLPSRIQFYYLLPVLGVAFALLVMVQTVQKPKEHLTNNAPENHSSPENHSREVLSSSGEVVTASVPHSLEKGFAELLFPSGTKVLITAPANYEVTGENSIWLQKGEFVANVPESGYGFQVNTPSGQLVDLGTVFSVHATGDEDTHLQVIRGKVIASLTNDRGGVRSSRQILENQEVTIDRNRDEISESQYFKKLSRKYGIAEHTRTVAFLEQMPDVLAVGTHQVFEHDSLAFIFPEQFQVTLPVNLLGDLDSPREEQTPDELAARDPMIPAGTRVDAFRIYYDPVNREGEGAFIPVRGVVQFERPIVGILLTSDVLTNTDKYFHPLNEEHLGQPIPHQGTEIDHTQVDPTGKYDIVSISEDRKTLTFLLMAGTRFVDEFRVLIQSK